MYSYGNIVYCILLYKNMIILCKCTSMYIYSIFVNLLICVHKSMHMYVHNSRQEVSSLAFFLPYKTKVLRVSSRGSLTRYGIFMIFSLYLYFVLGVRTVFIFSFYLVALKVIKLCFFYFYENIC
jgi:hypothetical protein